MAYAWSMKDDLYGPPPAYSRTNNYEIPPPPPSYTPSIYTLPINGIDRQERVSYPLFVLSPNLTRYLLGSGFIHIVIGLAAIICDIILTIVNESYSFTGLWTGGICIALGILILLFVNRPQQRLCSLFQLQCIHIGMCVIIVLALILSSINLASDSCYKIFLGPDRCEHSGFILKIMLLILFIWTLLQTSITLLVTFIQGKQSRLLVTDNDGRTPEIIG